MTQEPKKIKPLRFKTASASSMWRNSLAQWKTLTRKEKNAAVRAFKKMVSKK